MNSVWQNLLWKEWREHRLILAILTSLYVGIPLLFSLRTPTNFFNILSFTLIFTSIVGVFLAMGIAAGEQSAGTIGFLQALPISGRKPAMAKLFWAIATVVVPILAAVGAAALWSWMLDEAAQVAIAHDEEIYNTARGTWFAARCFTPSMAAVSLVLWIAAAGVNRGDEVRAGAIGILVAASFWLVLMLLDYGFKALGIREQIHLFPFLFSMAPGGVSILNNGMAFAPKDSSLFANYWPLALVGLASHGALAAWYIGRFGRVVPGNPQTIDLPRFVRDRQWLAPPMRIPLTAMAWKQLRESGPLAILGAACTVVIALAIYIPLRRDGDLTPEEMLEGMMAMWMIVGVMVATVAGVGVFLDEMKPGLYAFWRSRPINVDQWFAVKFLAGLLVTVATLAVPVLLLIAYLLVAPNRHPIPESLNLQDAARNVGLGLLAQCCLYSVAVAAMILLRRPIHAAVAAFAIPFLAAIPISMAAAYIARDRFGVNSDVFMAVVVVPLLTLAVIVVAWLAVRKNWGWKH
jgi:ABC-type transport system involved in multi-copper enzyme maturation permease subunit